MRHEPVEAVQTSDRAHWSTFFAFLCFVLVVFACVFAFAIGWSMGTGAKIAPVPSSEMRRAPASTSAGGE